MITGFNTDVEHDGVIYHVQTEDKGLESPLILSLVYTGGAILASKRSPYQDLIAAGFDEAVLADRLKRQHRLICAAIRAGRVDELRRMNVREAEVEKQPPSSYPEPRQPEPREEIPTLPDFGNITLEPGLTPGFDADLVSAPRPPEGESPEVFVARPPSTEVTVAELEEGLRVSLLEEQEFHSGQTLNLGVLVTHKSARDEKPVGGVSVSVKVLGTTFRPVIVSLKTQKDGVAIVATAIPKFSSGRAAILVRAVRGGESVEIRRVVNPA